MSDILQAAYHEVALANSRLRSERDELRAEIERLLVALAKQTEQQAYPCSPHCAGYLREQAARAEIERLKAEFESRGGEMDSMRMVLAETQKWNEDRVAEIERLQAALRAARVVVEAEGARATLAIVDAALAGKEAE